jgi:hypothetical protein
MKRAIFAFVVLVCVPAASLAQTEGKISVGASVSHMITTDEDLASVTGVGVVVRLNPKRGWGPAGAFNWFRADIDDPTGGSGDFARIRIRPLMAGIAYTVGPDKVLTSFSIVAGPSFNSFDFRDDFLDRVRAAGLQEPSVDIETSFVVRPGVNVTWTVAPRVGIVGFGGYLFNRPGVVYRDPFGVEHRDEWKADAFVISVGAVYSLF